MTAGKRPRLMMRRTVSVASLGGAGGATAAAAAATAAEACPGVAGSDRPDHHQHQFQGVAAVHHHGGVVPPRQVIGFAAPKLLPDSGDSGPGGEFSSSSSPSVSPVGSGAKSRPFSGLSMLADPIKELGGGGGPSSPHGKVGLGIVAALDKTGGDYGCSSPTSVIRAAMVAQAGVVAPPSNLYLQQQQQHHHHQAVTEHGRKQKATASAGESAAFHFVLDTNSKCSLRPSFTMLGFLESCYQCKRDISHGRDIFMYRGDRAFCSAECRHQQILNDERLERREKCTSAALKQMGSVPQQARRNERAKVTPATTAAAA